MTHDGLADTLARGRAFNLEALAPRLGVLNQRLRPADGWLAVVYLAFNLMVVVWSVEKADWVPTPSLAYLILLAMLTGLVLSRVRLWAVLVLPVGLGIGLLVIVWQLTSFSADNVTVASTAELWERLGRWVQVARSGNISLDSLPFAFGLMASTWLLGYLAAWVFFRYQNFWGVFVLGGAGLLSNLTYLPDSASADLLLYLFTGLILVARVEAVRRRREWRQRQLQYDGHLGFLSLSDSVLLSMAVLLLAYLLPVPRVLGPANHAYELMRTPLKTVEDDFNRLFAGLPARRPISYRIWDDVMAFQGTLRPTTTPVLQIQSQTPMYWKARSYGTYSSQGWVSEDTVFQPIDWVPTYASGQLYRSRFEVTYSVIPNYSTKSLFAGGQLLRADQDVRIETYDSPKYTIDLGDQTAIERLSPRLALAAANISRVSQSGALPGSRASLAASLPPEFRLVDVTYSQGRVQRVILAEVLPELPDVLSVRTARGKIKPRSAYNLTSSVSTATPAELRRAGTAYPTWALIKYTQLPDSLPQRVRDLSVQWTVGAATPYDKAKAIESQLQKLPYSLVVEPPPFQADGVDHFLFTLKRGYSEYFASSMTVLLRVAGVPARLVTGYTVGDKVADHDVYVVTDSHSHAWVEVFFPHYGWIPFEPTPGASLPAAVPPGGAGGASPFSELDDGSDPFDLDDELEFPFVGVAAPIPETIGQMLRRLLPWLGVALGNILLLGAAGWLFWRRYMVSSGLPEVVFRRLAMLGGLASLGPQAYQTPFQYQERLTSALPTYRSHISVIVDTYVRSFYGRKEISEDGHQRLARAWTALRGPLLFSILRQKP